MKLFKIFAGLGGGFGGAKYIGTYEYENANDAAEDAYRMAEEEYQSYEGHHGILSPADVEEDLRDSGFIEDDMTDDEIADMIDYYYREEIERWIDYRVKPVTSSDE